ncbi:ABC transporter substrate-binding protein [Alteromonas sp. ALT199]|uniref:ABC transporter substrate-binding protein n=1 Tax=unclassified Alteromonas TaxID=2614992 RepID=UPI00044A9880|nr:ABC transporter substrate-binding protein [Alteromonas sp. ALT199]
MQIQLITMLALVTCLMLSACTPPQPANKITISGPFEPVNNDPASTGYMFTRMQVLETLVEVNNLGQLVPGLASSWKSNSDFTQWEFTLRADVHFHDGALMTANAVYKSLAVAFGKPTPFPKNIISDMEVTSDNTIAFTLNQSYRPFPSLLSNYTTAVVAPSSFGKFNRIKTLAGTGPYKISHFEPPHNISTTRFDNYWGEPAHIENVEYITGHRSETRALMVRTGQADIVYNLDPASVTMLRSNNNVNVFSDRIPRTTLIKLNSGHPFLTDVKVRQALSLALDRESIARGVMRTPNIAADQLFGPNIRQWHVQLTPDETLKKISAAQAKQQASDLLSDAGWALADDGYRYKDGARLALNMITYANRPELITIATAIQDQWAQIGVALSVHMENVSAIPSGHADGTLETALMARNFANIPDPLGIMLADFSTIKGGDWGPMNWRNDTVFSNLNLLSRTTNDETYNRLIESVMSEIRRDVPLIPVMYYVQQTATSNRLRNFSFDPYERSFRVSQMTIAPNQ